MKMTETKTQRRRSRLPITLVSFLISSNVSMGFVPHANPLSTKRASTTQSDSALVKSFYPSYGRASSGLNVWWFGGTEQNEPNGDGDSCELVAVRIEKTSANSRKIAGDITVPASLSDVWSILTDYNRLSIHVPNLMESRITQKNGPGEAGDGSFRCRLFQKGAQKIIGFDFSASVTMDMTEKILADANDSSVNANFVPQERKIAFKCVDSQFFSNFDGEWTLKEVIGVTGEVETLCSYVVDVRPKGPVPVAALEWRIREDVPTNLRAVKAATLKINRPNTMAIGRTSASSIPQQNVPAKLARTLNGKRKQMAQAQAMMMDMEWDRDETMAKYL